jgi:hypothetical protein
MVHPCSVFLRRHGCIGLLISLRDRDRQRKRRCGYNTDNHVAPRGYLLQHWFSLSAPPVYL